MPVVAGGMSRPGQQNAAGDVRALLLAKFTGMVLAAFDRKTNLNRFILKLPLTGAGTGQFPAFGRIATGFHVPGNNIFEDSEANDFQHVKRTIDTDDLLTASTFVDDVERMRTEYEFQSKYMGKIGEAMAVTYEEFGFIAAVRSARSNTGNSATLIPGDMGADGSGGFVASIDLTAGGATAGGNLLGGMFTAAQLLDEKEVPDDEGERWCPQRPIHYYQLVRNRELLDRDFGNEGNGIFFNGTVFVGAGFGLFKTNHLPNTNIATNPTGANNLYTGDFTATHAVAFQREAIATLWLKAPQVEFQSDIKYQGWFFVGSTSQGTGRARFESAVEISSLATQAVL